GRRDDVDLPVVARRGDGARWRALPGVNVVEQASSSRPMRLAWEQLGLPGLLGRLGVDVHHAPHYTMPRRARLPQVVTVHDLTFFDHPEWHESMKVRFFRHATRVAAKRAHALVCAFDRVAAARPDLTLVLGGIDGWGAQAVAEAVADARHGDRVRRLGYVADDAVPALLRGSAAVAYPSLDEGFGLPALEALACGAPLVTTEGTAMAEVTGDAAVLIPPGDVDALGQALEALVTAGPDVD